MGFRRPLKEKQVFTSPGTTKLFSSMTMLVYMLRQRSTSPTPSAVFIRYYPFWLSLHRWHMVYLSGTSRPEYTKNWFFLWMDSKFAKRWEKVVLWLQQMLEFDNRRNQTEGIYFYTVILFLNYQIFIVTSLQLITFINVRL